MCASALNVRMGVLALALPFFGIATKRETLPSIRVETSENHLVRL